MKPERIISLLRADPINQITPTIRTVHLGLDPDGNLVETTEFDYNTIVYGFSPL